MLNLNLAAVSRGAVRVQGEIARDDPVWEGTGLTLLEPLRVELEAGSVGEGVLVRGRMGTRLGLECRRCLVAVEREIEDSVDLLYEPLSSEDEAELAGEVYPLPERGTELDLAPALREQLLLRVPDYVVCREECRGLCPQCGADRNAGPCECVPEEPESPWDALRNLKFD